MQTRHTFLSLALPLLMAGTVVWVVRAHGPAEAAFPAPLRVPLARGAVAADMPDASRAGAELLARGGNAVDAAVATALALGVVNPTSSGLGGGGFLLLWRAQDRAARALDFRETAPAAAHRDMYVKDGRVVPGLSRVGGLSVAIPGEAAGLAEVAAKYGKLGLSAAVKPAVRLAREGFVVQPFTADAARTVVGRTILQPGDAILSLLRPGGAPLAGGDRLRRPELARALELLGARGADGFYKGEVARTLTETVQKRGGVITLADLAGYRPVWRDPIEGRYRGHTVYAVPPPSGGVTAVEALQILDARPPIAAHGPGSSAAFHALAESFKHAFADRARSLGDPAFVAVPLKRLVDPAYAKELAMRIADDKVQKAAAYGDKTLVGAPVEAPRDAGTSHLCVIDGEGNVVAMTSTVNLLYGSVVMDPGSGIVLNDEMDDFSAQPAVPNAYGLIGGFANAIAPGKRPVSSMNSMVIVKDGRPVMCVGASGGPTIVTSTVQAVVNVIDFGLDAQAAVASPRVHAQWMPDELNVEDDVPADVRDGLRKRGHTLAPMREKGACQTIVVRGDRLEAASDPRKGGAPASPPFPSK